MAKKKTEKNDKVKNENNIEEVSKKTKKSEKEKKIKKEKPTVEKKENQISNSSEFAKLVKIVLIVTAIMLVFYLITLIVTNKADDVKTDMEKNENVKAEIQYDYIMIGTMLNRDGAFYVLIEADEDNRLSEYSSLIDTAKANEDVPTIYRANLTDSFNKGYLSKESNYDVSDIKDFRVTGTTLVKVVDGAIKETYDNYDTIKGKLTELSK